MADESATEKECVMDPSSFTGLGGQLMAMMLMMQGMSSQRQDETVARQAVIDNQRVSHLNATAAIQSQYEVTLPEAFAAAKMAQSWGPGDAMQTNLAAGTPITLQVVPKAA